VRNILEGVVLITVFVWLASEVERRVPPFSSMNSTPAEKFTDARSIPQFREGAQPQVSVRRNWQAARFAFVRR
jgi:hypothetical protein